MKFSILIAAFLLLFGEPTKAVIGNVDVKNEFPFVVKLDLGVGYCSGAVTVDNLVTTAAHCVWDDEKQTLANPNNIKIAYVDMDGNQKTTGVTRIFIPKEYRTMKPWKTISDYDARKKVEKDVAILIPKESIELYEYSNWITDVFGKEVWNENLDALTMLSKALGSFSSVSTRVVGYGGFGCLNEIIDADDHDNCKRDGKRRYAEAPLLPSTSWGGALPNVWCSGIGADGVTPIRKGDSGGPQFVKALDGRWLYVGNTSASFGAKVGCASSLVSNIALWKELLDSNEYRNRPGHSDYWFAKRAEHAVEDFFEVMTSSPEQALPRVLATYYGIEKDESANIVNVGGIDHRGVTNIKHFDQKKKLIETWPVRNFKVDSVSAEAANFILPRRSFPGTYHIASGYVSWSISNPTTGERKEGRSRFDFTLITLDLDGNPIEAGTSRNPTLIWEEDFTPTLGKVQDFKVFQNLSYDGGDIENIRDTDLENCERLCKITDDCFAFSYIEKSRWCWLKSYVPTSSAKPGITSGMKETEKKPPARPPKATYQYFQDFSFDGADYKDVKGIELESCRKLCKDEKSCAAFSYIDRLHWCWLKSAVPSSSTKAGIISGLKERP
jgi:hypothetical protein